MANATAPSPQRLGLNTGVWIIILAVLLVIFAAAAIYLG